MKAIDGQPKGQHRAFGGELAAGRLDVFQELGALGEYARIALLQEGAWGTRALPVREGERYTEYGPC